MEHRTDRKNIWRRMFRRALTGDMVAWYRTLSGGAIHTYEDLERAFKLAFTHRRRRRKFRANLLAVSKRRTKVPATTRVSRKKYVLHGLESHVLRGLPHEKAPEHLRGGNRAVP